MKTERFYSRQFEKFIDGTFIASTSFRPTDSRTVTVYFTDIFGMVHSTDMNYSILTGSRPRTMEEFNALWISETPRYAHANRVN